MRKASALTGYTDLGDNKELGKRIGHGKKITALRK